MGDKEKKSVNEALEKKVKENVKENVKDSELDDVSAGIDLSDTFEWISGPVHVPKAPHIMGPFG